MNCQRTSSLLSAYLDRELTGEEMLLIRSHLAGCPACEDEHEALRMVKRLLGALPQTESDTAWADALTGLAVAGRPTHWDRLCLLWGGLELRLLADDAGVLRGRRFARSLALSALALFLVAAPFAQRETSVTTGAMGPSDLELRPVWQPSLMRPALAPPLAAATAAPLPLADARALAVGGLGAPTMQLTAAGRFTALPQAHRRWLVAPWSSGPAGNYLTFSSLEH